jgi:hypothetical protein
MNNSITYTFFINEEINFSKELLFEKCKIHNKGVKVTKTNDYIRYVFCCHTLRFKFFKIHESQNDIAISE